MKIKVMSWNVGGAKFLKLSQKYRDEFKHNLNKRLNELLQQHRPEFVVLQEIVQYSKYPNPHDLIEDQESYYYFPSIAIDTINQNHPRKWQPFRDKGKWPTDAYLAQGYGILWRHELKHCSIWNLESGKVGRDLQPEVVHIDTGLYTGDRDSEPRLAVVAHFVFDTPISPLDVFIVKLHLTTFKGEREGSPEKDDRGSHIRLTQIDTILHGIVSRYNEWRVQRLDEKEAYRMPAIWILAGDFNCIPDSPEIKKIKRLNFVDLNPNKGTGTKASGLAAAKATISLDYIFAGPKYYAIDPYIVEEEIKNNLSPIIDEAVSAPQFSLYG